MRCWIVYRVVPALLATILEVARCSADDDTAASNNLLRGDNIRDYTSNIINSETAEDGRYNYAQISLQYPTSTTDTYLHQCGGSLIAPDMILTAAHCSDVIDRIYIDIYDVISDIKNATINTIQSIAIHPQFDEPLFRYDFAIIHINQRVDSITPIRLNNDSTIPATMEGLTVIGWGATQVPTETTNAIYPKTLQKGSVQLVTNQNCESTVINGIALYQGEIFPEMLCAEGPGVDACAGDSGGPLVVEGISREFDVQVGLVSWGRGCAVYPGVYSRISMGYDWIRSQVCYKSVAPPSYMGCQPEERNPINLVTAIPAGDRTVAPIATSPVTVTKSPITTSPVTVTASPITGTPVMSAPMTNVPTQNSTKRPSYVPSRAPITVVRADVFPPAWTSSGPSDQGISVPFAKQQITSDVLDNDSIDTSSIKSDHVVCYSNVLMMAFVACQICWSVWL